jgi:hypothetical protein
MQLREYRTAQTVMTAATRLLSTPELQTRVELLAKLKRWEDAVVTEDDPSWPVQQLMIQIFRGSLKKETLEQLMSKREGIGGWDESVGDVQSLAVSEKRDLAAVGLPAEIFADMVASILDFEKEGSTERGFRVKIGGPTRNQVMFVVREAGRYRIVGIQPDGMEILGALALECLEKKDIEGARWWLDQAVKGLEARADGTGMPAVHGLWSGITEQTRGAAAIRVAAAAIIGAGEGKDQAIQTLRDARVKAPTAMEKGQVDKAICESLAKAKKWDELVLAAKRLGEHKLFSEESFRYSVRGLSGAGKWKELETEAQKRVTGNPLNLAAMRALVLAMTRQGNSIGAVEWAKKMSADHLADTGDRILAARSIMAAGKAGKETLAVLKKDAETGRSKATYQYTVAMMHAVLDQPDDARQALLEGLARQDYEHVDIAGWAAYGKICELYGYSVDAEAAFARAREASKRDGQAAEWVLPLLKLKAAR